MTAVEALLEFLARTVSGRTLARYTYFVESPKRRRKFLRSIYHDLRDHVSVVATVPELPESAWNTRGYLFQPENTFGVEMASLGERGESEESYLAVATDCSAAVLAPERFVDERLLFLWTPKPRPR